ncbi:hypothetical protein WJX77_012390 [Trebouxia sp. C0004]
MLEYVKIKETQQQRLALLDSCFFLTSDEPPVKKKRGRPRKTPHPEELDHELESDTAKKRGRLTDADIAALCVPAAGSFSAPKASAAAAAAAAMIQSEVHAQDNNEYQGLDLGMADEDLDHIKISRDRGAAVQDADVDKECDDVDITVGSPRHVQESGVQQFEQEIIATVRKLYKEKIETAQGSVEKGEWAHQEKQKQLARITSQQEELKCEHAEVVQLYVALQVRSEWSPRHWHLLNDAPQPLWPLYFLAQHRLELDQDVGVKTAAQLAKNMVYQNKEMLQAGLIVAGWDKEEGGSVYAVPLGGTLVKCPFAIGGSGSAYI